MASSTRIPFRVAQIGNGLPPRLVGWCHVRHASGAKAAMSAEATSSVISVIDAAGGGVLDTNRTKPPAARRLASAVGRMRRRVSLSLWRVRRNRPRG